MSKKQISYQEALSKLENIVEKIENEEMDVDELSNQVKQAVDLVNTCKARLRNTEEELQKTLENEGSGTEEEGD